MSKHMGSTEFRPRAISPKQREGATKGLRVINSVDSCVFKSKLLYIEPLQNVQTIYHKGSKVI